MWPTSSPWAYQDLHAYIAFKAICRARTPNPVKVFITVFLLGVVKYIINAFQLVSTSVLATIPKVLILDEHTTGLDPHMAQGVLEVLNLTEKLHMKGISLVISIN